MTPSRPTLSAKRAILATAAVAAVIAFSCIAIAAIYPRSIGAPEEAFAPRNLLDDSGFNNMLMTVERWHGNAPLAEIEMKERAADAKLIREADQANAPGSGADEMTRVRLTVFKAFALAGQGKTEQAGEALKLARRLAESDPAVSRATLYTVIFEQGVNALRLGENENCVQCLGAGACIVPIDASAVHAKERGSRAAVGYFTEYLQRFPDDAGVKWLLNLACMTLGEYPNRVPSEYRLAIEPFFKGSERVAKFENISHRVGLGSRVNNAGGAIMDDFDNDGLLDIVVSSFEMSQGMELYRNDGQGGFEAMGERAGLTGVKGGVNCMQTDFDNDGRLDLFVVRGAWLPFPVRPALLRNDGKGRFTDVTKKAGLDEGLNAISAAWSDYDNDGDLDVFIPCEAQPSRLYRNEGDGTFREVLTESGLDIGGVKHAKGSAWLDYDRDRLPDLFITYLDDSAALFHNEGHGRFRPATAEMGIEGPREGFSCWAWDFDNDGWEDLFATSYSRQLPDIIAGLSGNNGTAPRGRLYRNGNGRGYEDLTQSAGLNGAYATMGSNFTDLNNDGFLDIYLATGDPAFATLVPNRAFCNVEGKRFEEVTAAAGMGHLQKGHGVACGDWDRDGDIDVFCELGGAVLGDQFHNALFQNPGGKGRSLTVKLVGKRTNRAAIGARIKVVTSSTPSQTMYRHVNSGSSFGANALEQTIGIGSAAGVRTLEVFWPTSNTTQVFHDIPAGATLEITEFAKSWRATPVRTISPRQSSTSD